MNERLFGSRVGTLLNEAADRLPYRVAHRLDRAREAALARLPDTAAQAALAPSAAGHASGVSLSGDGRSWLWRALAVVLPPVVVAAGLYGIVEWTDAQDAQETAEVDAAVLVDDVPISAYADRGFGVYLNNNTAQ